MKLSHRVLLVLWALLCSFRLPFAVGAEATLPPAPSISIINHEIWGIPWGLSMDEFTKTAYQNTGIVFKPNPYYHSCQSTLLPNISVFGQPVKYLYAAFTEDSMTNYLIKVLFRVRRSSTAPFEANVQLYEDLLSSVTAKYGAPIYDAFGYVDFETGKHFTFDLLSDNTHINAQHISIAMQKSVCVGFYTYFDNIALSGLIIVAPDGSMFFDIELEARFYADDKIDFSRGSLGSYDDYLRAHPEENPSPTAIPATPIPIAQPAETPLAFDFTPRFPLDF